MPGRLGRNLRGGHRAEARGVELLRALCAVAQVGQTEDIGLDAVATILYRDGRFLVAEQPFCVQFKARSVREIEYDRVAYAWLQRLGLPLLIGSVDLSTQEVALYTTHHAACRIDAEHYGSVVMHLEPVSVAQVAEAGVLHQYLGEPILRWTGRDGESEAFQNHAHAVLKAWVAIEQLHYPLRMIKTTQLVQWHTNEVPTAGGAMLLGHPNDLRKDIEAATPYLTKVGMHLMARDEPTPEAVAFIVLAKWLEDNGAGGQFNYIAQLLATRLAKVGAFGSHASEQR